MTTISSTSHGHANTRVSFEDDTKELQLLLSEMGRNILDEAKDRAKSLKEATEGPVPLEEQQQLSRETWDALTQEDREALGNDYDSWDEDWRAQEFPPQPEGTVAQDPQVALEGIEIQALMNDFKGAENISNSIQQMESDLTDSTTQKGY